MRLRYALKENSAQKGAPNAAKCAPTWYAQKSASGEAYRNSASMHVVAGRGPWCTQALKGNIASSCVPYPALAPTAQAQ